MPISFQLYAAFILASIIIVIIPGPTVVMVISQALAHGRRVALASVAGVGLGDFLATSLSLAGAGAVLATSSTLFQALKLLGAAYLIYVGIKMWRSPITLPEISAETAPSETRSFPIFRDAFLVTALNPKGILFFVAFVPQFIDPALPYAPQAAIYVATFTALGIINAAAFAMAGSGARHLVRRPGVLKTVTRAGGTLLMMAGMATALTRRAG